MNWWRRLRLRRQERTRNLVADTEATMTLIDDMLRDMRHDWADQFWESSPTAHRWIPGDPIL